MASPPSGHSWSNVSPKVLRASPTGWKKLRKPAWLQPPTVPPEVMPWARLPAYRAPPLSPGWVQMLVRVRPETVPSA